MPESQQPGGEACLISEDTVCAHLRAIGEAKHDGGPPLVLIESLDGYALLDCLLPEHRLADMTLQYVAPAADGDGCICKGFMAQGDRLVCVTILVMTNGTYRITDFDEIGQILRPERIENVSGRLNDL